MFQHIVRVDSSFMLLNGLLLLGITVVPFPTNLVSQYVLTPEQSVAAAVYNGWFLLIVGWTSCLLITALDLYGLPDACQEAWNIIIGATDEVSGAG